MKIALISYRRDPFIYPNDLDGGAITIRNYVLNMYKNHEVHIFTRFDQRDTEKRKNQIENGVGTVRVQRDLYIHRLSYNDFSHLNKSEMIIAEIDSFSKKLFDLLRAIGGWDIVHYFHPYSLMAGIPPELVPISVYSPLLPLLGRNFEEAIEIHSDLEKTNMSVVNKIIACSEFERKIIKEHYKFDSEIVHLGVNTSIFHPNDLFLKEIDINKKKIIRVIVPAAIKPQKNTKEAVDVLLKNNYINIFVGEIQDEKYYEESFKGVEVTKITDISEAVEKGFYFLENKGQLTLANYLREVDVALLPSRHETLGLITLECMASGLIVVAKPLEAYSNFAKNGKNIILDNELKIPKIFDKNMIIEAIKTAEEMSWENEIKRQIEIYKKNTPDFKISSKNWNKME